MSFLDPFNSGKGRRDRVRRISDRRSDSEPIDEEGTVSLSDAVEDLYDEAMELLDKKSLKAAEAKANRALQICAEADLNKPILHANVLLGAGVISYSQNKISAAMELFQRALSVINSSSYEQANPLAVSAYVNIGLVHLQHSDYSRALDSFRTAQNLSENVLGMDRLVVADIYHNIGFIYDTRGDLADAVWEYQKSISIREKIHGESHLSSAATYHNLGQVYKDQKKLSQALDMHQRALKAREDKLGPRHELTAQSRHDTAAVLCLLNRRKQALQLALKAVDARRASLGPDHDLTQYSEELVSLIRQRLATVERRLSPRKQAARSPKPGQGLIFRSARPASAPVVVTSPVASRSPVVALEFKRRWGSTLRRQDISQLRTPSSSAISKPASAPLRPATAGDWDNRQRRYDDLEKRLSANADRRRRIAQLRQSNRVKV